MQKDRTKKQSLYKPQQNYCLYIIYTHKTMDNTIIIQKYFYKVISNH